MNTSLVGISSELYEQARISAEAESRTAQGQIEFWAKVGKAAEESPDLPAGFVVESVSSLAEPRSLATEFKPQDPREA